jgi:hypothetical protein
MSNGESTAECDDWEYADESWKRVKKPPDECKLARTNSFSIGGGRFKQSGPFKCDDLNLRSGAELAAAVSDADFTAWLTENYFRACVAVPLPYSLPHLFTITRGRFLGGSDASARAKH